ncbi:MAG: hypothetical protein GY795_08110, partial [Desulfobacterales bacterium]|nr:hypothetical protein [Desulfobacterales bacterium]
MAIINTADTADKKTQNEQLSDIEKCADVCGEKFNQILSHVLEGGNKEARRMEESVFKHLMQSGLLLLQLWFVTHNHGNYGKTAETAKGTAERGRTSEKTYFSIFGKLKVSRYLYHTDDATLVPLDIVLNLPIRCYSYLLSEFVSLLNINGAYENSSELMEKFFGLKICVSASETVSDESSDCYEDYYDLKNTLPKPVKEKDCTVVSFDGKGVPMIKKEAAKITGRKGKGKKRQKKKEALAGAKYNINANHRTAEEVATNLIYPEKKENNRDKNKKEEKAQDIRYIASVEKPKKEVMEEIREEVKDEDFSKNPLLCLMDGAPHLRTLFKAVFKDIGNTVLISDIIHVSEYIRLIAHIMYKEGSDDAEQYVYEKLLLIL